MKITFNRGYHASHKTGIRQSKFASTIPTPLRLTAVTVQRFNGVPSTRAKLLITFLSNVFSEDDLLILI